MQEISKFLGAAFNSIRENTANPQFRIRTLNSKSNLNIINYLNNYRLMGKKHLDYKSWCSIAELFIACEETKPKTKVNHKELLIKAKYVKTEMNDNRKIFTWDHLNDFYSIEK